MNEQESKLRDEILRDADAKTAELLAAARAGADAVAAQAAAEIATLRSAEFAKAEAVAAARCRAILSATETEIRRRWMIRREAVLAAALADGLQQAVFTGEAGASLEALLAEAVAEIAPAVDGLALFARPEQAALLTPERLAAAARRAGVAETVTATWRVIADDTLAAGLVVTAADGRRRCDQTFAARLARQRPELRMMVAEQVGA